MRPRLQTQIHVLDRLFHRFGLLKRGTPLRVHPRIVTGIVGYHLLACLAFVPWLFCWSSVALAVAGIYIFGTLGINIGFHRLLTHRGFACPRWLERCLSMLGVCCWQGTPMNWVAIHRMHHQHSDDETDPHSPVTGNFFWAHMGWFMVYDPAIWNISTYDRYARDLLRDRFYKAMERPRNWRRVHLVQSLVYFLGGALAGAIVTESWLGALQLGLSTLVWGVFVRTVLVWHITWSINSLTHMWGYRNFETKDHSRNSILIGLISNGEGYHNNHHAQPRSAAHGMRWWEFDVSYVTIWFLAKMGLAWDVVKPRPMAGKMTTGQVAVAGMNGQIDLPVEDMVGVTPLSSSPPAADVSSAGAAKSTVPDGGG